MVLHLISHPLCPYVQRIAIALSEKGVPFKRTTIDLKNKPRWFTEISPLGKTPVLMVKDVAIFESSVILEYLEEAQPNPLHPSDILERAQHRSWIEFGSSILNDIAALYSAKTKDLFNENVRMLMRKFQQVEDQLGAGPFFSGQNICLVDVVFAPVFRYFDTFDQIDDFGILGSKPKILAWRASLSTLTSVQHAVDDEFDDRLEEFLLGRNSYLTHLMAKHLP